MLDYHKLGDIYRDAGELEKAIAAYQKQTEIKPQDGDVWNKLGATLLRQHKLEEAKKAFAEGLKVQANPLFLLSNDAELALMQRDKTRLKDRIERALKAVPPKHQLSVILPFLAWLAEPTQEQVWADLKQAIAQLTPEVPISWDFSNIKPVLEDLDKSSQREAEHLIAFFKDWEKAPKSRLLNLQTLIKQIESR